MLRASFLVFVLVGCLLKPADLSYGQLISIDQALKVSRQTGKPIFAIASRKVCPPCKVLKSRVAELFERTDRDDQVVYLRIDLDGDSWKRWSQQFPHKGRMLPVVYLIRPDGQQLYGQSNTLPGKQLSQFIDQGVAYCGRSYTALESQRLAFINQSLEAALKVNEFEAALKWTQSVRPFGKPGQLNSFATEAIRNNQLVKEVELKSRSFVQSRIGDIQASLQGDSGSQFKAVSQFVTLERALGEFEGRANDLSKVAVKLAIKPGLRKLWGIVRELQEAQEVLSTSQSKSEKLEAIGRLQKLEHREIPANVKMVAAEIIRQHDVRSARLNQAATTK
ncbi:MAG: hypothetical protein VX438_17445 [Planctomycetota bacterium]|nr:hypothetical protein [Planctomycetota bacterium]